MKQKMIQSLAGIVAGVYTALYAPQLPEAWADKPKAVAGEYLQATVVAIDKEGYPLQSWESPCNEELTVPENTDKVRLFVNAAGPGEFSIERESYKKTVSGRTVTETRTTQTDVYKKYDNYVVSAYNSLNTPSYVTLKIFGDPVCEFKVLKK